MKTAVKVTRLLLWQGGCVAECGEDYFDTQAKAESSGDGTAFRPILRVTSYVTFKSLQFVQFLANGNHYEY